MALRGAAPDTGQRLIELDGVGQALLDLEPLSDGFWSSAYSYRVGERSLVLRLGTMAEGFEMDRAAMAFTGPDLPVPAVLDIGEALGMAYAISGRRRGRFLEDVEPREVKRSGPALMSLLAALRWVPSDPRLPVSWEPGSSSGPGQTWRQWLNAGLVDDPKQRVSGWRAALADDPELNRLFRAREQRIDELLAACPERRDLVHGDLLHRNVLVAEDASEVTAIFSWKCSVRGDFLFDVAWCTFWAAWHPGIEAMDLWDRTVESADEDSLVDAAIRHHCYELQIGASHLGWNAWTHNADELRRPADRTAGVLERGPRSGPRTPEPGRFTPVLV